MRYEVPVGHEKFGKIEACACRSLDLAQQARERLYALSSLENLSHLTFENFRVSGNPRGKHAGISEPEREALLQAKEACQVFAERLRGWVLLEGSYGSGKTHLAAAIANAAVEKGVPTLFVTVPDLLDMLRFAYNSPETTYEKRFEEIRSANLLVMDDFGTQNATGWAQEKLFQILNHRYINKLPTVVTTNLALDEIEGRVRSRLQDEDLVLHLRLRTVDYRHPDESANPGLSMLSLKDIQAMKFSTWQGREGEIGQEAVTVRTVERRSPSGFVTRERVIERETVRKEQVERLRQMHDNAAAFADAPEGWLALLGPSFCGKTHLAAAIGNYRVGMGGQAVMADVSSLLDYLRATFRPNSEVHFDRRFYEIRTTPLLILDGLKESSTSSTWAEDKLYQLLNFRYYEALPTVLTSNLTPEEFPLSYPGLWNKLLDSSRCKVLASDMPPFRRQAARPRKKKAAQH